MAVDYKERIPTTSASMRTGASAGAGGVAAPVSPVVERDGARRLPGADTISDGDQRGCAGWAHFDYVRMPEYRWGIFWPSLEPGRTVGFGAHRGPARGRRCRASTGPRSVG